MAFIPLQAGYSGLVSISSNSSNSVATLATSYDLTINQNYLKSQGIFGSFMNKSNRTFNRLGGLAFRDFAGYELTIGLQATTAVFSMLMNVINKPRTEYSVRFQDSVYGCDIRFDKAFINSISVQISNNALTTMSVGFFIVKRDVQIKFGKTIGLASNSDSGNYGINNYSNWGRKDKKQWIGNEIIPQLQTMPYYGWGFRYNQVFGSFKNDYSNSIMDMSFQWQQNIEMKHALHHEKKILDANLNSNSSNSNSGMPVMLLFGMPSASFSVNMLLISENSNSFSSQMGWNAKSNSTLTKQHKGFTMGYKFNEKNYQIIVKNPLVQTFSPQLANKNDVNTMSIQGSVLGKVEFSPSRI